MADKKRKRSKRKGIDLYVPGAALEASQKRQELRDRIETRGERERERARAKDQGLYVREVSGGAFELGKKR